MLRFVCKDGVGLGTEILNPETGEDISKLLSVKYGIKITIGEMVTAQCELMMVETEVAAKTEWLTKHPISGDYVAVAAFEFHDGTRVEFSEDGTPRVVTK